ncbi:MAG TPA: GGDEF domain-containing protein [Xanthobacteraceae bacterium]|nr:GGDEF domain-containing protein [Xanthobacteraceae bacterium]
MDLSTLFLLTMYVEALLGLLLFLAWVQNLLNRGLAWWGAAHLMRSLSIALYGMHGSVPDVISIDLAGILLFTSFGLVWTGARVFDGRAPQPAALLAGAVVWMFAGQLPGFADSADLRHLVSAGIIAAFSWATAYELWRGRNETLVSRWPAIVLLFAHGALFLHRTPTATLAQSESQPLLASAWVAVLTPEALLFTISIAFVLLAMGKERAELGQKTLATTDALTGVSNRRGFMQDAETVTHRQVKLGRPVAVFLVDLDHFKAINDRFGHALGDRVLRLFAQTCSANVRSTDLVGRIGGEEFAVLLADANRDNAFLIAERIRLAFEAAALMVDDYELRATASIGVAIIQDPSDNLSSLLRQADQALYRAKTRGRNRVELAPVEASPDAHLAGAGLPARARISR